MVTVRGNSRGDYRPQQQGVQHHRRAFKVLACRQSGGGGHPGHRTVTLTLSPREHAGGHRTRWLAIDLAETHLYGKMENSCTLGPVAEWQTPRT
jgi:hypothetical protein